VHGLRHLAAQHGFALYLGTNLLVATATPGSPPGDWHGFCKRIGAHRHIKVFHQAQEQRVSKLRRTELFHNNRHVRKFTR
jgi:hypothetical protein